MKTRASQSTRLQPIWDELGEEEREVMLLLAGRLLQGQRSFGRLDLARDRRDWRAMGAEEFADSLMYGAFEAIRRKMTADALRQEVPIRPPAGVDGGK